MILLSPTQETSEFTPRSLNKIRVQVRRFVSVVAATALLALCAHVSFLLPLTPIPITMQTVAVLLLGMLLGPVAGMVTMVLYLTEGALGLPVFSPHGVGGLAQLSGPSAGYLLSYPCAAMLVGWVFSATRQRVPTFLAALFASVFADAVILVSGSVWLSVSMHQPFLHAAQLGILPFLLGETYKIIFLASAIASVWHLRKAR